MMGEPIEQSGRHFGIAEHTSVPAPWIIGPIDLGATTGFSRCHEVGAAISRYYGAAQPPTESEFAQAFLQLMDWYDRLAE